MAGRRRALQPNAASANLGARRGAARWRAGIEALDLEPAVREIFLIGFYTGMRRGEIVSLRWDRIDLDRRVLRVEETKSGEPLELPITRQLAAIFERRLADIDGSVVQPEGWVFPSSKSGTGYVAGVGHFHNGISEAGGAKFWFHGLRNAFITVAERELMLPRSLTKRLVNHARPPDVTEGYAADWTVDQLREPAQRMADRIDELMHSPKTVWIETRHSDPTLSRATGTREGGCWSRRARRVMICATTSLASRALAIEESPSLIGACVDARRCRLRSAMRISTRSG